ncbi:uncharacterized mitochondrial protein AtMg00820-like [Cicer arietinum]|uniref:uncharacterized mitochondrial protein AtMg00820-like n=1 Tax=Cicer arietinum TaxID=3827 RepID=UPI003CC6A951
MVEEIDEIEKNQTWYLTDLPPKQKQIGVKWVYNLKLNPDGTIAKYKARLVTKGFLQRAGIDYSGMEYGVYVKHSTLNGESEMILLCLYVDDLLVTGSSSKAITEFKKIMKDEFEMTDLGKLNYFMGMEFAETEEGLLTHQKKYAREILR